MKKISLFIITALFLYLITAACKKDKNDTDNTPVETIAKIDSVIDYANGSAGEYSKYLYDAQGRVVKILYMDGGFDSLIYSSTQVLWKYYWSDGSQNGMDTYMLDSRGLATTVIFDSGKKDRSSAFNLLKRLNFNSITPYATEHFREYDANKYMIKETYYNYFYYGDTATYLYTITKGNVSNMALTITDPEYPDPITETFSYYADKQNTIGDQNSGITFLGKQNNNLYKTIIVDEGSYYPPDTTQFKYKFDAKNRVSMMYSGSSLGLNVDSTRYTYKN